MSSHYEDLTDQLSLDEQAALAGGDDVWHTVAVADRGIPRLKTSDGPVGVRGESHTTTTSASFPCGSALGATFDPALVAEVGAALAAEAKTKGVHVVLGPTINLHRHPLGGRNFEAYAEDPALTARLAVAFVRGLQAGGVAACAKHFAANDAEIERMTISSEVDERTLREVVLRPFEAAVLEAGVWTVMGAYNRLHGTYACEHRWLLTTLLKEEWGFDGVVVSDWMATHDTVRCASAGLDLEMPGPAQWFGPALAGAVRDGEVPPAVVADKARRLLRLADRVAATVGPEPEERSEDDPVRWALATAVSAAATVLLRNEPVEGAPLLPLDPATMTRVAVIGPNAEAPAIQGGGSAAVTPHRVASPVDELRRRLGDGVDLVVATGCPSASRFPVLDGRLAHVDGTAGVELTYRARADGPVLLTNRLPRLCPVWFGDFSPEVGPDGFHVTISTTFVARRTGQHRFALTSVGPAEVRLDGDAVLDSRDARPGRSFFGLGGERVVAEVDLEAGVAHELVVTYDRDSQPRGGLRLGVAEPGGGDLLAEAVAAARTADVAVIVVGTDEEWETEGRDRRTLGLPPGQDDLVRAVVAANPRTVVIVNAGAAVDLPWADEVPAILQWWFPGMAGGEALARVLLGEVDPRGRLPITVPFDLADAPCDISHADPPGQLRYTEGLDVGHRWYLSHGITPRWWFGHGLSYAPCAWGSATAPERWRSGDAPIVVRVPVTNPGSRSGTEVVQAYLRRPASSLDRPTWVFGGSTKVEVGPGDTIEVDVTIDEATLRHWDVEASAWAIEPGPLEIRIARSAGDAGHTVTIQLEPSD